MIPAWPAEDTESKNGGQLLLNSLATGQGDYSIVVPDAHSRHKKQFGEMLLRELQND